MKPMSWIPITIDLLHQKSAGAEVDAARTAALALGEPDPVPGIIEQVVREVRGYVANCPRNTLGPAGTIPDELLGQAINRIRFEAATRIPGGALMDDDRRTANRDAWTMIKDAGRCAVSIEQPEIASEEVTAGAAGEIVSTTHRTSRTRDLDGL